MSKTNIDNDELSTAASRQWERGNLREARRLFLAAAENGDVSSQGSLAVFCELGYAGPRDLDRAKYWYRKAIRGGCSVSVYNFAHFYGKLGNRRRMFFWLHRSVESDDSGGMLMLAKELLKGRSPNARSRAIKLLEEAIDSGSISENDREESEAVLSSLGEPVKQPCNPEPVSQAGAADHFDRAAAWHEKGEYGRAIADYSEAIRLRPYFADAHFNRGIAWGAKGEYDRAIDDYSAIIGWYADDAGAYNNRGLAWANKGEHDNAIADYGVAIHLRPGDADAYNNRGMAYFILGRYTESAADLQIAQSIDPNYDGVLCLYLARERSGISGREELSANAQRLALTKWPAVIVGHYLGQDREEAVLAAARDANPAKQREQECEAFFYLGQTHLLRGDNPGAIDYFGKAVDSGVTDFIQYEMAVVELERLGVLR